MTAEQLEGQWRRGRRQFAGVPRVLVTPVYVEGWERRMRALDVEREAWLAMLEREPDRPGNWLRHVRIRELDRAMMTLALVRQQVQAINAPA